MAVSTASSPSGFSYAQAAKGRAQNAASQPSSKTNSGLSTPANGGLPDASTTGNWADEAESVADQKMEKERDLPQEQPPTLLKDSAVERIKSQESNSNVASGASSLDLVSSSLTDKTDDSSAVTSVPSDATSASTWETKSQASEGAWIADREKRQQSSSRSTDSSGKASTVKDGKAQQKDGKDAAPARSVQQPPPVLHDAPAPAVNPWAKRAEDAKAKSLAKPATTDTTTNALSRVDAVKHETANEGARNSAPQNEHKRLHEGKRSNDSRSSGRQGSRPGSENSRADVANGRPVQREHQSLPNLTAVAPPPPNSDESSWPTPDIAQHDSRKESSAEKDTNEMADGESVNGAKPRERSKWTVFPVTPTIKWETEEMNRPPRERTRGGGSGTRGRGGFRGTPNGFKDGGRGTARYQHFSGEVEENSAGDAGRLTDENREGVSPPVRSTPQLSNRSQSLDRRNPRHRPSPPKGTSDRVHDRVSGGPEVPRTGSPRSQEPNSSQASAETKATGSAAQVTGSPDDVREAGLHGENASRRVASDSRRESRTYEGHNNNKEWTGSTRGSKRGGRGRGGSREFSSGHQAAPAYPHGNSDFAGNGNFSIPPSPSIYHSPRGGFGFPPANRGGWRGGPRAHSIPVENNTFTGQRYNPYPHPGQVPPPLQNAFFTPVYEPVYNSVPMSAVPYAQAMDHQYLLGMVSTQMDYYFSLDNLLKDTFLRKHMDSQGFVFFDVIVNFPRVKNLSPDRDLIKAACLKSEIIEIRVGEDGKERLRKREGWQQFVLPMDQRESTSQNDGPQVLQRPEAPQLQPFWQANPSIQYRGPASAGPVQRASFDIPPYAMNGMVPPFSPYPHDPQDSAVFGEGTEELLRGRTMKPSAKDFHGFPGQQPFADARQSEPDTFLDQNVNELNVIYKPNPNPGRAPFHSSSSRTFSNGSIDTRNIASEIEKLSEHPEPATTNGNTAVNGDAEHQDASAASNAIEPEVVDKNAEVIFLWLKDQVIQQEDIPKGTHVQPYIALRSEALAQRERGAPGTCPHDLDILYKFWSHFLIRNFNARMYAEFKFLAIDDARVRDNTIGLTQLVNFYVNALKSNTHIVRDLVVADYIDLVKDQPSNFQNYAFKQLRQAWRDGATNLKNRKKLTQYVDEPLRAQLES